jgi:hypothetical protein
MLQVSHLFISPGHNFYGHHGRLAGEQPIVSVEQVECVAGRGIRGIRPWRSGWPLAWAGARRRLSNWINGRSR